MVVDSSVWIEIFLKQPLSEKCLKAVGAKGVRIPVISYYEIYKKLRMKLGESEALEAIGALEPYSVIELTREICLLAADLALEYDLAMADSLVLACARECGTILLTLDHDFVHIPGVNVITSSSRA